MENFIAHFDTIINHHIAQFAQELAQIEQDRGRAYLDLRDLSEPLNKLFRAKPIKYHETYISPHDAPNRAQVTLARIARALWRILSEEKVSPTEVAHLDAIIETIPAQIIEYFRA